MKKLANGLQIALISVCLLGIFQTSAALAWHRHYHHRCVVRCFVKGGYYGRHRVCRRICR